jgi:release factor glutamine methyltransferase
VRPYAFHNKLSDRIAGIPDVEYARFETDKIIEHLFGVRIGEFFALVDVKPTAETETEFERIAEERERGVPLAYILGYAYFNDLRIFVQPGVLIPRQETEGLALIGKRLIEENCAKDEPRILDFGAGSGCIAAWLALELPFSLVWASDISSRAVEAAERNVKHYGLTMRVITLRHDGLEGIVGPSKLDLLISNPPYIAEDDGRIDESVRLYEPREALIAPGGGLHYFRHIARWGSELLAPGGFIAVETGDEQAETVRRIFYAAGADEVTIERDLAGIDRYVIARYDRNA